MANMLQGIAGLGAGLCIFAGLVLFAVGKLTDTQGGRGEAVMIGCFMASAAFAAAAAFITTVNFNVGI